MQISRETIISVGVWASVKASSRDWTAHLQGKWSKCTLLHWRLRSVRRWDEGINKSFISICMNHVSHILIYIPLWIARKICLFTYMLLTCLLWEMLCFYAYLLNLGFCSWEVKVCYRLWELTSSQIFDLKIFSHDISFY